MSRPPAPPPTHTPEADTAPERLRLQDRALASISEGVILTDARREDGPIVYANAGFGRLTGYAPEEVLGRNCRFLQGPGSDRGVVAQVREAVREGRPFQGELLNYRKDGTPFVNALSLAPVRDAEGRLTHFVGVQQDVTAQRQAEASLRQREAELRQAHKMAAVGRLAGGLAHDFNNLLTIIALSTQHLLSSVPPGGPLPEGLDEVLAAVERGKGLTGQLLALSRKRAVQPRLLDLNATLRAMDPLVRRLVGSGAHVELHLHPAPLPVRVDPSQLEQVVLNLAANARDAMPEGGTLRLSTALSAGAGGRAGATPAAGPHATLSVEDSGTGIPPEALEHVFEPFFTTKEEGAGTGLGLATVYQVVEQSGGRVEVESAPGRGTAFRIHLPLAAGGAPTLTPVPPAREAAGGSETVLLVEDDAAVRRITRRLLLRAGYQVLEADDGPAALVLAGAHGGPLDLLLTDVQMPGMSGVALAERLRSLRPAARVLFMSGFLGQAKGQPGASAAPLLEKPFTPGTLLQRVREALDSPAPPEP
jgi:PAS domain S-box-containing protein